LFGSLCSYSMFHRIGEYLQAIVEAFVADDALSRGASISFYTVTSIGPVLFHRRGYRRLGLRRGRGARSGG
jgi:uncharacterized BrkB/YihY/UPF0761 family membrane protein